MNTRSAIAIRFTMAALFLWFGVMQLIDQTDWIAYLPSWTANLPISQEMFVKLNGAFEVVFALLLAVGFYTRVAALLLGLHLLGIAVAVRGSIGVRDAALALTTLALAYSAPDAKTLDAKRATPKTTSAQ